MLFDDIEPGLKGQELVMEAWHRRAPGRDFIIPREDFDFGAMASELAHISVLVSDGDCFRFRLAGTGVIAAFGCEPRGLAPAELDACRGNNVWTELAARALARMQPVSGRTRLADGTVHYWMRLPMSADGEEPGMVLCHDRFLAPELADDPDKACKEADRRLRRDTHGLRVAA
jgi:hypothetical protein